ncbi:hypothetical protein [Pseudonocardia hydrocarbonoxydans]|uniref:ABC-2 type transport system permease protein n=1 Tax=Pseudonocardia hydrocarbonoxydans TaxID=76726 RepID=A0A4Y3WKA4_9PSEU|nr:hypothetical protein [Pseudonocardia hydrocarbonoxydans]GEC19283.1 hypothetical protein PHY01_15660 [Pseudonocardia hydrocarbonoxydans]
MVGTLIRLRFAIQRHTPGWKRLLGLVLGIGAALLTWAATLIAPAGGDVLLLVLAGWLAGWLVGPVLSSGAAVLRPEYFALLPLERRRLGAGLLASVFVGVGAAVTAGGLLALVGHAIVVADGPAVVAAVAAALLGATLLLVLVVSLSRAVYAVLGAAMRTRLGVEVAAVQYGLLIATLFAGWLVVSPVVGATPVFLRDGFAAVPVAASVLGWAPSGWPVRAVEAAADGRWPAALGWLGMLAAAAAAALCVAAAVALLTPHVGDRTARRARRPLGSRVLTGSRVLPATPLGAVAGKELRAWWRDPWRSLEVRSAIWFGVFLAVFGVLAGMPRVTALSGVAVALMVALSGANLFGQDGTALWQLVVGQSPAAVRADIRGRQVGLVVSMGVPAVLLALVMALLTGTWALLPAALSAIVVVVLVGSGVAVVMSVVGVTPGVDPHRRVNATDAGENNLSIQVALWATLLLVSPTVVPAVLLVSDPGVGLAVLTATTAVVNGVAVAWLGGAVAIHRLTHHLPETFARLRYPGTGAGTTGGSGVLDRLSGHAEKEALTAAAGRR